MDCGFHALKERIGDSASTEKGTGNTAYIRLILLAMGKE
jgi:hypothetical protein